MELTPTKERTIAILKGKMSCDNCIHLEIVPGEGEDFYSLDYYCTFSGERIKFKWCIHWEDDNAA